LKEFKHVQTAAQMAKKKTNIVSADEYISNLLILEDLMKTHITVSRSLTVFMTVVRLAPMPTVRI